MSDNNKIAIVCSPVQLTAGVSIVNSSGSHFSRVNNKELVDYVMNHLNSTTGVIIYGPEAYTSKIRDKINQEQMKKYKKQKYDIELRSKLY
jgi:hypothetical protein